MFSYQEKVIKAGILIRGCLPFIIAFSLYLFLYGRYFINDKGVIGGDYSYFFPQLLSGYYWYLENGIFATPWFTPGFCGGLPLSPNPQSIYYSVPQFLLIWFEPLHSVYVTFIIFAGTGMIAFYLLLSRVFKLSKTTAFVGSFIFLFNGFYSSRMIMGHLTYHVFMLIPVIASFLICPTTRGNQYSGNFISIILSGILFSYVIYAGALNFIVPLLITLIGIYCCFRLITGETAPFWSRLILSGFLGLCITSGKLFSTYYFISQFPRDIYSLPGFDGFVNAFINVLKSLSGLNQGNIAEQLVNLSFPVTKLGFDFSVGVLSLAIIFLYFIFKTIILVKSGDAKSINAKLYNPAIWLLVLILSIPLLLNTYYPVWNDVLKSLPYIKNSSLLTRWIAIDIPLLIVIFCYIVDKLKHNKRYNIVIILIVGTVLFEKLLDTDQYIEGMHYNSNKINIAYLRARESRLAMPVQSIGAYIDEQDQYIMAHARNDEIAAGISILNCYEPIFGYFGEQFPVKQLKPGPVTVSINKRLNLKNPSCYIFPDENSCQPGDHFLLTQKKEAEKFINYKSIDFVKPTLQKIANWISLLTFVLMLVVIFVQTSSFIVTNIRKIK